MRRTVPSRCDRPDGNCGRLVGRQASESSSGIWLAALRSGDSSRADAVATREEAVAYLLGCRAARSSPDSTSRSGSPSGSRSSRLRDDRRRVGARGTSTANDWLAPTAPFWETGAGCRPSNASGGARQRIRPRSRSSNSSATDRSARARCAACRCSRELRRAGVAIWPFDAPADRTVVRDLPVGSPQARARGADRSRTNTSATRSCRRA